MKGYVQAAGNIIQAKIPIHPMGSVKVNGIFRGRIEAVEKSEDLFQDKRSHMEKENGGFDDAKGLYRISGTGVRGYGSYGMQRIRGGGRR